jgi:hypothetical protein|tara:strand:- start:445 stop:549 length:105 start_codon:yes stop_codon:yes gene_type:complete
MSEAPLGPIPLDKGEGTKREGYLIKTEENKIEEL